MAETCPKCGEAVHDEATAHPICCECGWDALEWERAENARLREQLAEANEACAMTSPLVAEGRRLGRRAGLEEAAVDCERRQCHGQAAILRRLAPPPAEENSPDA